MSAPGSTRSSTIRRISVRDPATGEAHYTGKVSIPPEEFPRIGEDALVPGIPVEAYVMTEERIAPSNLVKPLINQLNRAFRER